MLNVIRLCALWLAYTCKKDLMGHVGENNELLSEWERQGQWGSHLFLPVKCTRPLARLATACLAHYVSSLEDPIVDLQLPSTELHISLSRHFALRSHQVMLPSSLHTLPRTHPYSTSDTQYF